MFDSNSILQDRLAECLELRYQAIKETFAANFYSQCNLLGNGCLVYLGGHTVRIPEHLAEVNFTTPRRAAYLICNDILPGHDLKPICGTPRCVLPQHLAAGRRRPKAALTRSLVQSVLSEPGKSIRYLASKHGLDRKTVKRIIELNECREFTEF